MIERSTDSQFDGSDRDAVITAIPNVRAEELVEVIRNGLDRQRCIIRTLSSSFSRRDKQM